MADAAVESRSRGGASEETIGILDSVTRSAATALFEAYDLEVVERVGGCTIEFAQLVSSIGFASDDLCGSVMLALPIRVVAGTQPTPDEDARTDWAAELANQLSGRIKNQLLRYGVAISIALPVVVLGCDLDWSSQGTGVSRAFVFDSRLGEVVVKLDANLKCDLCLVESTGDGRIDEGDLMMF